jgi:exodeoxyribonuclease VII large subunit
MVNVLTEIKYIKLSELTRRVEDAIKLTFGSEFYWIVAEISSHKFYPDQERHYFEFIEKAEGSNDPVARVRGVAWRIGSQTIKEFERIAGQKFSNGIQILGKVKIEFHQSYGLSLVLHDIDLSFTLGNIERQRRETLQRLVMDNPESIQKIGDEYITSNKKLKLSTVIQNIAIIGSPNSEGYIDFTHTIANNLFKYKFTVDIYQSSVQGVQAEKELISKLISIYESGKRYDCAVIIRGGGAKSDFLVFDTYGLARAIARFPIPVITGLGHHKDISIVDLMVNASTKTPTKAAEFIISHNRQFEDAVVNLQTTVIIKSQQLLGTSVQKVNSANISIVNKSRTFLAHYKDLLNNHNQVVINRTKTILYSNKTALVSLLNQLISKPKIIAANRYSDTNNILENLKSFTKKYIINQRGYIGHYVTVIKLMSPQNILRKGFAIVLHKGAILKDAAIISLGSEITVSMEKYDINTKVISKNKKNGTEL